MFNEYILTYYEHLMHSTQTAISISLHEHNAEQFCKLYESLTRSRSIIRPSQQLTADSVNEYPHHPRPNDFQLSWQASEKVYYALNHAWADSTIRKYSNSHQENKLIFVALKL